MNLPAKIQLPDVARMGRMPSLPEWAALRVASLEKNLQRDKDGKYRELWTLPAELIPSAEQAATLQEHADELRRRMTWTPLLDAAYAQATIIAVTKMLLALPRAKTNEIEAEAKAEAYMDALDDVPCWAVQAAVRGWHRSEYGEDHDYRWAPVPSELRKAAEIEAWKSGRRIQDCERVIIAVPIDDKESPQLREAVKPLLKMKRA